MVVNKAACARSLAAHRRVADKVTLIRKAFYEHRSGVTARAMFVQILQKLNHKYPNTEGNTDPLLHHPDLCDAYPDLVLGG